MQQKGRAYFISKLLKDVVFNEARLASGDRKADKRRRRVAIAAWSIAGLLVAGGGLYGWSAWSEEQARAARLAEQVGKAEQAAQGVPFDRITDAEFRRILPYMDAARGLPPAAAGRRPAVRPEPGREARSRRQCRLSPRARPVLPAAPAGPARGCDAHLLPAAGRAVRRDARLPDARPGRAARCGAGQELVHPRLVPRLPRRGEPADPRRAGRAPRCHHRAAATTAIRWMARWSMPRGASSRACRWRTASSPACRRRRRRRTSSPGGRPMRWARRGSGTSCAPRARR